MFVGQVGSMTTAGEPPNSPPVPSWRPLATMELRRVLHSPLPWVLAAILPLWLFQPSYELGGALGRNVTIGYLAHIGWVVVPLVVVLVVFGTVAGDRSRGHLPIALNLPLSRTDVLAGKFIGRFVGVLVPVALAVTLVTAVGLIRHGLFAPTRFVGVAAVSVLYLATLVAMVVALSTLISRMVTAVASGLVLVVFMFDLFWEHVLEHTLGTASDSTTLLLLAERLSPSGSYQVTVNWLLGLENSTTIQATREAGAVSTLLGETPWYLHEAWSVLILIGWLTVGLTVAVYAFNRGDLR